MSNQDEHSNKTDQPSSSTDTDDTTEIVVGNFKTLLLTIGGVAVILSILVLLPMILTYFSEGDLRAVGGQSPTDNASTSTHYTYK